MTTGSGHVELDRAVDAIRVGYRHRADLGELDDLLDSIRRLGLLQPITISPDGTLICGARRLEAVKRLGWKRVNVWVRSGISTRLEQLLAEQHENTVSKPFSPTEAASLYRELKTLLAEDATRRQRATRFGSQDDDAADTRRSHGAATMAAPAGDARVQAAMAITGTKSYTTLERVNTLQDLAVAGTQPDHVRGHAAAAIAAVDADGHVAAQYRAVTAAAAIAELERLAAASDQPAPVRDEAADAVRQLHAAAETATPAELARMANDALARAHDLDRRHRPSRHNRTPTTSAAEAATPMRRYGVRAFALTWTELDGWTEHYDPAEIGPALSNDQWARFQATIVATVAFAAAADAARTT